MDRCHTLSSPRPIDLLFSSLFTISIRSHCQKGRETMSFLLRTARSDNGFGLSGINYQLRTVHGTTVRPWSANSMAYLLTLLLFFINFSAREMMAKNMIWYDLAIFLAVMGLGIYAACQRIQTPVVAVNGLLRRTERMSPSTAFATRARSLGLRLHVAQLYRELNEFDYASRIPTLSEDEINALPVHKFKVNSPKNEHSLMQQVSNSSACMELTGQKHAKADVIKALEEEMTCIICLESVRRGELVRSLPCLHQFHANCIDPWLRQAATCPVCKFEMCSRLESRVNVTSEGDMV